MSITIDDYSPIFVGDTSKPFAPYFVTTDANNKIVPLDLTGLTISMKMQNEAGTIKTCSGIWTTIDAPGGTAQYAWQSADVDTSGTWTLFIKLTDGSGKPVHGQAKVIEVLAAI